MVMAWIQILLGIQIHFFQRRSRIRIHNKTKWILGTEYRKISEKNIPSPIFHIILLIAKLLIYLELSFLNQNKMDFKTDLAESNSARLSASVK